MKANEKSAASENFPETVQWKYLLDSSNREIFPHELHLRNIWFCGVFYSLLLAVWRKSVEKFILFFILSSKWFDNFSYKKVSYFLLAGKSFVWTSLRVSFPHCYFQRCKTWLFACEWRSFQEMLWYYIGKFQLQSINFSNSSLMVEKLNFFFVEDTKNTFFCVRMLVRKTFT